jgi:hypothetical protein
VVVGCSEAVSLVVPARKKKNQPRKC